MAAGPCPILGMSGVQYWASLERKPLGTQNIQPRTSHLHHTVDLVIAEP